MVLLSKEVFFLKFYSNYEKLMVVPRRCYNLKSKFLGNIITPYNTNLTYINLKDRIPDNTRYIIGRLHVTNQIPGTPYISFCRSID